MNCSIRLARAEDFEALALLQEETAALHRERHPERFQPSGGKSLEREWFQPVLADPNSGLWVADAVGQLVGYVQATLRTTPATAVMRPQRYGYINEVGVASAHRGQGIGQRLMAAAEDWLTAQGASAIEVTVYEFNAHAIEFYEQQGYTTLYRRLLKAVPAGPTPPADAAAR